MWEQTFGHQWGKAAGGGGGGVMNWAIGIDLYTLVWIKLMANKKLLYKKINKIQKFKEKNQQPTPLVSGFLFLLVASLCRWGKLRLREINWLVSGHTGSKLYNSGLKTDISGWLDPFVAFLDIYFSKTFLGLFVILR